MYIVGDRVKHKQRGTLGTVNTVTAVPHVRADAQSLEVTWDQGEASNTGAMPSGPMLCMSLSVERVENSITLDNVVNALVYLRTVTEWLAMSSSVPGDRHYVNASLMARGLPRSPHQIEDLLFEKVVKN